MNLFYYSAAALLCTSFFLDAKCLETLEKTTKLNAFILNTDGTVTDSKNKHMWSLCSQGQLYVNKQCEGEVSKVSWGEALAAAKQSGVGAYKDWRLPNKNELNSIIELSCFMPSVNIDIFPATGIGSYWSSGPYDNTEATVWTVDFATGNIFASQTTMKLMVRFVRDL